MFNNAFTPSYSPVQQMVDQLSSSVRGIFDIQQVNTHGLGQIEFSGRLIFDPDQGYDEIQRRFNALGYTPSLLRQRGVDVLVARRGLLRRAGTGNPTINIILLLVTIATTLAAGSALAGGNFWQAALSGNPFRLLRAIWLGLPFAGTLLLILGVHEMGHYIAARLHRVVVTLPYFIPMPFNGIGTFGAFIALKSPMKHRRALFDVGVSGPLAGFVVALPLLVVGILLSTPVTNSFRGALTLDFMGSSLLIDFFIALLLDLPANATLAAHPIFFAAWLGLLITGINLLPVGQLDGGHIAYALFGRAAHTVALVTFVSLIVAGFALSVNWFVWAFFVLLGGLRHPAPLNDLAPIGGVRRLIGYGTIVLFFLVIIPMPFAG